MRRTALSFALIFFFATLCSTALAAPTMQNDSESIILPAGAVDVVGSPSVDYGVYDQTPSVWLPSSEFVVYGSGIPVGIVVGTTGGVTVRIGANNQGSGDTNGSFDLISALGSGVGGLTFSSLGSGTGAGLVGGGGIITISGSRLRAALIEKGIKLITVLGWDFDDAYYTDDSDQYEREAGVTTEDVAVIAAAAVFRDQNIEEVTLSETHLGITYRTKGWLIGLIPIQFTVRLSINAAGTTDAERVQVSYPWYRFFTWLSVSPNALAANINAAIIGNQAAGLNGAEVQARLFTQVTNILRATGAKVSL